ncbi:hypothetical protein BGZ83_011146 [Gryganskiella cystojenkinii]|nr:hypothetical protein BGZ83_011146 [Gryganskiella cystojenkinii]
MKKTWLHGPVIPSITDITQNASLVRKIIVDSQGNFKFPGSRLFCPNLTELQIMDSKSIISERSLNALIKKHRKTLTRISSNAWTSSNFLDAVAVCSNVKEFTMTNARAESIIRWRELHDSLWSRLQTLTWSGPLVVPLFYTSTRGKEFLADIKSPLLSSARTTNLQSLDLSIDIATQTLLHCHLLLIFKSPALVRLKWRVCIRGGDAMFGQFLSVIRSRNTAATSTTDITNTTTTTSSTVTTIIPFGQRLEHLFLSPTVFTNEEFKEMIQSVPNLTKLELPRSGTFDTGTWNVIKSTMPQFLMTLRELNLKGCQQVMGSTAQDILCSMASLEVFAADTISDTDILKDDRPWACSTRLWKLSVAFLIAPREEKQEEGKGKEVDGDKNGKEEQEEEEQGEVKKEMYIKDRQAIVAHRLSTLVNLRVLDLRYEIDWYAIEKGNSLQLSLDGCLGSLKMLERLERLHAHDYHYYRPVRITVWGEAEARWVSQYWINLKVVAGILFSDGSLGRLTNVTSDGFDNE